METEVKEPEVDVYEAAIKLAVAEYGDLPADVIAWRRAQFENAVQMAAETVPVAALTW